MVNAIQKTSKISHDGRNLMTRIPKAIEEEANLKQGDAFIWTAEGKKFDVKNLGSHKEFMEKIRIAQKVENRTKKVMTAEEKDL